MKYKALFFDSGIGGLSIIKECERQFGDKLEYFYCLDNKFFPYSEKDENDLILHITDIVIKLHNKYKFDICIISCNTASTIILERLRTLLNIPIVGVIPAIKTAFTYLNKDNPTLNHNSIGLLATKGTINREYVKKLVKKFTKHNISYLGTTDLVEMAEAKIRNIEYKGPDINFILHEWSNMNIKYIILGCTHFSFLKEEISKVYPNSILIDSTKAIMRRVGYLLNIDIINKNYYSTQNKTLILTKIEGFDNKFLKRFCFKNIVNITSN